MKGLRITATIECEQFSRDRAVLLQCRQVGVLRTWLVPHLQWDNDV
jgi:hypothetical protein